MPRLERELPTEGRDLLPSRRARYGAALAFTAASTVLTWLFRPYITPVIFIFFYPTVVAAAWYGGFLPAMIAAVVALVTADLLFIGPPGSLEPPGPTELISFAIFLLLSAVVSALMGRIRDSQARLSAQTADLEAQAANLEQAMQQAQAARSEAELAHRRSEHERWRVSVLAETSRAMAEAREYRERLEALAGVVVRELAEYCLVDVLDDDGLVRRVAVAARDPGRHEPIAQVRAHVPTLDVAEGVARVLRTGEPEILLDLAPERLARMTVSADHLALMERIAPRSLIMMPMTSNDRMLGCITFLRSADSPPFDEDDVELTRVLAIRAGVLVEMARLYNNALLEIERRREVERELQENARQLEELNVEQEETMVALAEQTQQAQAAERTALEASQAKSQFLAVMSHELRTPLNAIMGYTDLLQSGVTGIDLDETSRSFLDRIRTSVLHLRGLIDEILSLARIEAGKEEVAAARINVAAIVREVAAMVQPDAIGKGLHLLVNTDGDVIAVTDPGKLRQILINLASNAVKFTDRGSVELRLSSRRERIDIEVIDTGIGIAEADAERIFEPFTQVDQSRTRRTGGTGLGLAVSRRLARLLGGDLTVSSEPGQGSRFCVILPLEIPVTVD